MGQTTDNKINKNITLILAIMCIVFAVLAGIFAYGFFTKPTNENLNPMPSITPTPTLSLEPSVSTPITTQAPMQTSPSQTLTPIDTPTPSTSTTDAPVNTQVPTNTNTPTATPIPSPTPTIVSTSTPSPTPTSTPPEIMSIQAVQPVYNNATPPAVTSLTLFAQSQNAQIKIVSIILKDLNGNIIDTATLTTAITINTELTTLSIPVGLAGTTDLTFPSTTTNSYTITLISQLDGAFVSPTFRVTS